MWSVVKWPSRPPTLAEIHWVAGVFEGEGSFSASTVEIPQRDLEVLERVRSLMGGTIRPYQAKAINGPTPMFKWYASGPRSRGIARTLYHLLSARRQAQARRYLRISRENLPPELDPAKPANLLWDWCEDPEELEW